MVYYYGIQSSGVEAWDRMFKVFQENKVASEKTKLLYGLAAIQEPWALERYDNTDLFYFYSHPFHFKDIRSGGAVV